MKNRDYTLIIRDVTPEHQKNISKALSALQDVLSILFGTAFKSEYSPEPVVPEQWIVEVEYSGWNTTAWHPSENFHTRDIFATKAQAEAAIRKNKEVGDEQGMKYRVRQLDVPVEEQWIVELKLRIRFHKISQRVQYAYIATFGFRTQYNFMYSPHNFWVHHLRVPSVFPTGFAEPPIKV